MAHRASAAIPSQSASVVGLAPEIFRAPRTDLQSIAGVVWSLLLDLSSRHYETL
jgi:hypothetical protein